MAVDQAGYEVSVSRVDDLGLWTLVLCDQIRFAGGGYRQDAIAADGHVGGINLLGEDVDQLAAPHDEVGMI